MEVEFTTPEVLLATLRPLNCSAGWNPTLDICAIDSASLTAQLANKSSDHTIQLQEEWVLDAVEAVSVIS